MSRQVWSSPNLGCLAYFVSWLKRRRELVEEETSQKIILRLKSDPDATLRSKNKYKFYVMLICQQNVTKINKQDLIKKM